MSDYYSEKLSSERLMRCYEVAPPRVQQYLVAEVEHVLQKIRPKDLVLELGCGYGRVLRALAGKAATVIGIDTSLSSILYGRELLRAVPNCILLQMDALHIAFRDATFDVTVCIQNGISAFHASPIDLIRESVRVTKPGGLVLFSSYTEKFWQHRLEWFRLQADAGLVGEVDFEKTGGGTIVCKDGFTATTFGPAQFLALTTALDVTVTLVEVDESSLFCEIVPR